MPLHSNSIRRARPLLGTIVEVTAAGSESAVLKAIDAAFFAIDHVQKKMSFHETDSDVSRINRAEVGARIAIDPHTYHVIEFAHELSEKSQGAFDVTVAPALIRDGFLPPLIEANHSSFVTFKGLELLDDNEVRWREKGWIDLGGIAKGYAVDFAVKTLMAYGIVDGMVNAGGDLRCFGESQTVHLRHPEDPSLMIPLGDIQNCAIATSAGYFTERIVDDHWVHPIVDPREQKCLQWNASISVIAKDCMTADALTKIVRLCPEIAPDILACREAQSIVWDGESMHFQGADLLQEMALA